jgi:putative intracellular protease/amidase
LTVAFVCTQAFSINPAEAKCTSGMTPEPGSLKGTKALIVVTSHDVLGDEGCTDCKPTGVYGEEMTAPYWLFNDAGMTTEIVTIKGGDVPVDPTYNNTLEITSWDKRFFADPQAYIDSHNTRSVKDVDFSVYDIVYMAGGWGAAWDLGTSAELASGVSQVYANDSQFLGSVCHGALGFILATKPDGTNVCAGTKMTGVTDKQIDQLGIAKITPQHPEDELKKAGADYECKHGLITDLFENDIVIDGRIVTG